MPTLRKEKTKEDEVPPLRGPTASREVKRREKASAHFGRNAWRGWVCPRKEWCAMKEQIYGEVFLWNRGIDRLQRVLQRLETTSIWGKKELKAYETRLEEIRAKLNADFTEAMATRERSDESRLRLQRTAWEARDAERKRKRDQP